MSEEQRQDFSSHIKTLESVTKVASSAVNALWGIGLGVAGVAAWVAMINFRVAATEHAGQETSGRVKENSARVQAIEVQTSRDTEKLRNIENTVIRIDRKLNP